MSRIWMILLLRTELVAAVPAVEYNDQPGEYSCMHVLLACCDAR